MHGQGVAAGHAGDSQGGKVGLRGSGVQRSTGKGQGVESTQSQFHTSVIAVGPGTAVLQLACAMGSHQPKVLLLNGQLLLAMLLSLPMPEAAACTTVLTQLSKISKDALHCVCCRCVRAVR